MDSYEGSVEFFRHDDAEETVCDLCGNSINEDDEYDITMSGMVICADCALEQRIAAEEDEAEREKE